MEMLFPLPLFTVEGGIPGDRQGKGISRDVDKVLDGQSTLNVANASPASTRPACTLNSQLNTFASMEKDQ
jgi:hypothetical protein